MKEAEMKKLLVPLVLSFCFSTTGFSQDSRAKAADLQSGVKTEVESTVRSFLAGFGSIKCDDVTPVSKFVRENMIYVCAKDIYTLTLADYEQGLRDRACGWVSHTGEIESVVVDVLSKDTAVAAWLYHDEVKSKSGEIKKTRGSVLMTLIRSAKGWKITSTMSMDEKIP
jgi:hypothetical protein